MLTLFYYLELLLSILKSLNEYIHSLSHSTHKLVLITSVRSLKYFCDTAFGLTLDLYHA